MIKEKEFKKMSLLTKIKNNYVEKKNKKFHDSFMILSGHEESATGKGADIWGTDWIIPVAEEFEWHFFDDTNTGCQYITTRLTDYIFWFIPFTYDQYVYEIPGGTFKKGELTTKKVAELIYFCEHWNWHCDEVYYDNSYYSVKFGLDGMECKLGNNDYSFIRTK